MILYALLSLSHRKIVYRKHFMENISEAFSFFSKRSSTFLPYINISKNISLWKTIFMWMERLGRSSLYLDIKKKKTYLDIKKTQFPLSHFNF